MRTPTFPRTTTALSAAMASILTLTACGSAPSGEASTDEAVTRAAPAAGVDVFKAVVFGSGPVAPKLSMWSSQSRAKADALPASVQIAKLESALPKMRADGWSAEAIAHSEKTLLLLRKGGALPQVDAATRAKQEDFVVAQLTKMDPTFFQRFGAEMQSGNPVQVEAAYKEARTLLQAMAPKAYFPNARRNSDDEGDGDSGPLAVYIVVAVVIFLIFGFALPNEVDTRLGSDKLVLKLTDELRAR